MKLNPSIKNMSNEYIFFTDQTALTFRICLVYIFSNRKVIYHKIRANKVLNFISPLHINRSTINIKTFGTLEVYFKN